MNPHVLDPAAIQSALAALRSDRPSTPFGQDEESDRSLSSHHWNLRVYQQLASTNLTLWRSIQRGAPSHTVVIAQEQTQGKGQRGREWISAPRGLYLSAAVDFGVTVQPPHLLTLSTAWGIATQLQTLGIDIGLKWPNDLVVNDRKLGGILIETRTRGDRLRWVCVGVGLNWSNPVPATGITLYSLLSQDSPCSSINELAALTLTGIATGISRYQQDNAEAIAKDYETLLVNRDQHVAWTDTVGKRLEGVVIGVNPLGELRVRILEPDSTAFVACSTAGSPSIDAATNSPAPSFKQPLCEQTFPPGSIRLGYHASLS